MKSVKRQFGKSFAAMAQASPDLISDIKALRRKGVRISVLRGSIDAYCIKSDGLIAVGDGCPVQEQVLTLAHEANHMLRPRFEFDDMDSMTEKRFVRFIMDEEADCFTRECETADDLLRAGWRLTKYSRSWHRTWRRGGRAAVLRRVLRTRVIGTRLLYPEYYRRMHKESHA